MPPPRRLTKVRWLICSGKWRSVLNPSRMKQAYHLQVARRRCDSVRRPATCFLRQVANLVRHAWKFHARVGAWRRFDPGENEKASCESGRTGSEKMNAKVMRPLYRPDQEPEYSGFGLGLSWSQALVKCTDSRHAAPGPGLRAEN